MQKLGVLETLIESALKRLKRTGDLIAATAATSIAVNTLTGEQYLSIRGSNIFFILIFGDGVSWLKD